MTQVVARLSPDEEFIGAECVCRVFPCSALLSEVVQDGGQSCGNGSRSSVELGESRSGPGRRLFSCQCAKSSGPGSCRVVLVS